MSNPINNPSHYTSSPAKCSECGCQIECIDVTQHSNFCIGNALKYLWRADLKSNPVEDLQKAAWYIQQEIERRTGLSGMDSVGNTTHSKGD